MKWNKQVDWPAEWIMIPMDKNTIQRPILDVLTG